jgi:hypothetical protein
MIGIPFNDYGCLGAITKTVVELVENHDEALVALATQHPSTDALAAWIRTLPQRDDDGTHSDGPRVEVCDPPQRLRIPATDPNCVERAALYVAVAELLDPKPVRQLATLDTPLGLHTFPFENGAPVVLDPRVPRNCLDSGLAAPSDETPVAIDAMDAIDYATELGWAGAAHLRNGPSRARVARNSIARLVEKGAAPADEATIDAIGWFFAVAEQKARELGARAIGIVKTVALAIAELADDAIARASGRRNATVRVSFDPLRFASGLATIAERTVVRAGTRALELGALGITGELVGLVDEELRTEGLTIRPTVKTRRPIR